MKRKMMRFFILARNHSFSRRVAGRALIVENGKLLTIHRNRYSKKLDQWLDYYSVPGGGLERGETPEQAAVRELKEELGVDIRVEKLLVHRVGKRFEHYMYQATIVGGEPRLMPDSEEAWFMGEKNKYAVEWVDIGTLTAENLRYYADCLVPVQQIAVGSEPAMVAVDDRKNDIL